MSGFRRKKEGDEEERLGVYLCLEEVRPVALCPMADVQKSGDKHEQPNCRMTIRKHDDEEEDT